MSIVYVDESGDLGMSPAGSDFLVISAVKIDDFKRRKQFEKILDKVRKKKLSKKHKVKSELKFSNSNESIRKNVLNLVNNVPLEIFSVIIEKKYTKPDLKENLPVLYNYLLKVLFEKIIPRINNEKLEIVLDKCMSKTQAFNFENYIQTEFFESFEKLPAVQIIHKSSLSCKGLQAVDFVCGAFGHKYNTARLGKTSEKYLDLIRKKIVVEKNDLFRKK